MTAPSQSRSAQAPQFPAGMTLPYGLTVRWLGASLQKAAMRTRTLLFLLVIGLIATFAALNWSAFMAPAKLSLVITSVEAPLGVVMLVILAVVVLLLTAYMALWQGKVIVETRRHAKELQAQRALAEKAEESRFTELRTALKEEMERLVSQVGSAREALGVEIRESANSLAAMIGEMDDRTRRSPGA